MSIAFKKIKLLFVPKGFWGYLGVALVMLLSIFAAYQQIYHPFVILTAADAKEIGDYINLLLYNLFNLAQQCNAT